MLARAEVVLVGTANPENLGGVARLCANFAVAGLRLVACRVPADDPRALVVGRMARPVLEAARSVATLDEAVGDAACVVGFSARRGASRPAIALTALSGELAARPPGRLALVFGPEDAGLSAADVDRCDLVATIDLPGVLPSLNLTQAVAIALWELARAGQGASGPAAPAVATHGELDALVTRALAAIGNDDDGGPERERRRVHLRRLLLRAALSPADVRALHALVADLERR
jgi:tRNA (cytidine32/uridine32-2'-O)-methyltransferase